MYVFALSESQCKAEFCHLLVNIVSDLWGADDEEVDFLCVRYKLNNGSGENKKNDDTNRTRDSTSMLPSFPDSQQGSGNRFPSSYPTTGPAILLSYLGNWLL